MRFDGLQGPLATLEAFCPFGIRSIWMSTNAANKQRTVIQTQSRCWLWVVNLYGGLDSTSVVYLMG
ncbi:hypothetical protein P7K49_023872 [Saguinus oedipus]|uniref:Uncharacterized protein n=1 Tax=Saguinus oedipus TaxID=9490 RepID=A0ABQ9UNJ9_SAGOE|nr:hypothetical protein P7K49_023872 [Saguinus oedipus]